MLAIERRPFTRVPSAKKIADAFRPWLEHEGRDPTLVGTLVREACLGKSGYPHRGAIITACSNALGMYGMETVYYQRTGEPAFYYLNAGDTYTPTLIFRGNVVTIDCWDDMMEKIERSRHSKLR